MDYETYLERRNPCFSGQCFAIGWDYAHLDDFYSVAILVLVDSVLQLNKALDTIDRLYVAILVLVDSVLQSGIQRRKDKQRNT